MLKHVEAGVLRVAYEEHGPQGGAPVVLLHGFPYDVRVYDEVVPLLMGAGCRVLVPYLRGYGPTRFLSDDTPRSGQQAALAHDLLALLNALSIDRALLAGYDWGGRAACIVAALWAERAHGLVTGGGYNIQDIARAMMPRRRIGSSRSGTSTISTASEAGRASSGTVPRSAGCSGGCGHPAGASTRRSTGGRPRRSTTLTSWPS